MTDISLQCQCGKVRGVARACTGTSGNRVVCCCGDCQAFAEYLQCEEDILDEFGGTEIYQTSQAQVEISSGQDQLKSMRLKRKGLLRWYTGCCNTPVANTMNAGMPFAGIFLNFMAFENSGTLNILQSSPSVSPCESSPKCCNGSYRVKTNRAHSSTIRACPSQSRLLQASKGECPASANCDIGACDTCECATPVNPMQIAT